MARQSPQGNLKVTPTITPQATPKQSQEYNTYSEELPFSLVCENSPQGGWVSLTSTSYTSVAKSLMATKPAAKAQIDMIISVPPIVFRGIHTNCNPDAHSAFPKPKTQLLVVVVTFSPSRFFQAVPRARSAGAIFCARVAQGFWISPPGASLETSYGIPTSSPQKCSQV